MRNLLEGQDLPRLLPLLPAPLRALAAEPPVGSEWIPEVHFDALLLAVSDALGLDDAQVLAWSRDRNRALFRSPAYRMLMAVAAPSQLLRFAGARWANWHRGSTLDVEGISDDGVTLLLRAPRALFDPLVVRVFGEAFVAALELAGAASPAVAVAEEAAGRVRYRASWS